MNETTGVVRAVWGVFAFLFGAVIGSFLNVCVSRWPAGLSVVKPRSRCPNCGHEITAMENVPIVSWLALRARCSGCGKRISAQYPLVELAAGLIGLFAFLHYGADFTAVRVALFCTLMLGIALTDAQHFLIPDGFTVSGLVWVLLSSLAAAEMASASPFSGPWHAVLGMFVGAGVISVVAWLGEVVLRRPAMGFGDTTMMAVIGAAVGAERALLTVFLAAAIAPVILLGFVYPFFGRAGAGEDGQLPLSLADGESWRKRELPFGVFLAPAGVVALLYGDRIIDWYMRIAGLR